MLAPALAAFLALSGPAQAYDAAQAETDAKTILRDRGQHYLDARARLEANPELATKALMAQLDAPLGPAERKRVLSILSGFHNEELVPLLGDLLRKSLVDGKGTAPWRTLLLEHGAAAAPALMQLVGNRELTTEDRLLLLDDLVTVIASEQLASLVGTLGSGDLELRSQLRRSLARRGKQIPADGDVLRGALDDVIETGEPRQRAEAIGVRASLLRPKDPVIAKLAALEAGEDQPFVVRVAAIRALQGEVSSTHDRLARKHLGPDQRAKQASEILGWLALQSLPVQSGRAIVDQLGLLTAQQPRLAAAAYELGTLSDANWLEQSQRHVWPEVRATALGRVEGPCDGTVVRRLSTIGGPVSGGGEKNSTVGRAAVVALGRCGDEAALESLTKLLTNDGIGYERRGEAGRQLVQHGGANGAETVASLLSATAAPALAERLAGALARAEQPSDAVRRALCETIRSVPNAAATARKSFDVLFAGQTCAGDS